MTANAFGSYVFKYEKQELNLKVAPRISVRYLFIIFFMYTLLFKALGAVRFLFLSIK